MSHSDRLNIAVFIDFDNIEIGVKNTLGQQFDPGAVLDAIKERGEVVTKIAYADWTRAGDYSRSLTQHAIRLVQRNLTPGGDKNGADINLALDALEMVFTHTHINSYVIVGGDSISYGRPPPQGGQRLPRDEGRGDRVGVHEWTGEFTHCSERSGTAGRPFEGRRPAPGGVEGAARRLSPKARGSAGRPVLALL